MAAVSPLPTTKLLPPKVPAWAVARSRLDELLDHGTSSTLTLVSAPPGFGKTTLLADWAARRESQGPVCWVGLDEHDNSRARIWRAVAAAVAERVPAHSDARESSGTRASVDAANVLINRIAELDTSVVLILDDVHALGERSTLSDIAHLIKHAPPQLRLVLATRSDPSIPLGRYRLSGQLVEIRAAELAMTSDETRELLGPVADELSQAEIETLCQRTDGWAAALRLAAISLESVENPHRFVAEFAADDRAISDYLLNEVLDQQPDELRTFLLQTSLPDRFTAELAADLTGRTDAGLVLADLDRRNLFLHRHGREDATYRYHSFFRTFLRAELMLERPGEIRGLHRIVASSSDGRGTVTERIGHAIGARDWPLTASAATDAWPQLTLLEPPGTIGRLMHTVPPAVRRRHPTLALLDAIDLVQRGELEEGRARLDEAKRAPSDPAASLLTLGLMAAARAEGDMEELEQRSRELLEHGATTPRAGRSARRALRATALSQLGTSLLARGAVELAEPQLEEAIELALAESAHFAYLNGVSQFALLQAVRGRLTRSAELATEALEFASRHGWFDLLQTIGAHLALGWAHFHWDDLFAADAHFEQAGVAARVTGDRSSRAVAVLLRASCLAAEGPVGAAQGLRQLRSALGELDGAGVPAYLEGKFRAAVPSLLAERGDGAEAEALLGGEAKPFVELHLLRAKLALAAGNAELARSATGAGIDLLGPDSCYAAQIELWFLDGLVRRELRERAESRHSLERALELAAPDHYRRVFVGLGPAARLALVELVRAGTAHRSFVAELISAFDQRAPEVTITHVQLLEPLSEREKAILRYLPTMMSNLEIAGELYLSINTVKTHLRHVYRKLGVSRRRDAVERARQLSLL